MYVRLEADENDMPTVSAGYPKAVSDEWPGIDGPVDAAFTDYVNDKTYFFMRDYRLGPFTYSVLCRPLFGQFRN